MDQILTVLDSEDVYALEEYMASYLRLLTLLLDFTKFDLNKKCGGSLFSRDSLT